jgi:hypothetical protein
MTRMTTRDFKKKIFWVADLNALDLQAVPGSLVQKNLIVNSIEG